MFEVPRAREVHARGLAPLQRRSVAEFDLSPVLNHAEQAANAPVLSEFDKHVKLFSRPTRKKAGPWSYDVFCVACTVM